MRRGAGASSGTDARVDLEPLRSSGLLALFSFPPLLLAQQIASCINWARYMISLLQVVVSAQEPLVPSSQH